MKSRDKTDDEMPRAAALPGHGAAEEGRFGADPDTPPGDVAEYTEDLDPAEDEEAHRQIRDLQRGLPTDDRP